MALPCELPFDPAEPAGLRDFLRAMPKVEIHCHLLGTVRKQTFAELAAAAGAAYRADEIEGFYTRTEQPKGILHVLRALDGQLIRTADHLHRLAYEYLADASQHGIRYAEFFWNPTGTAKQSRIPYPTAVDAIVRAIHDAQHDHGVVGRLIPSIDREASAAEATEMAEWVAAHPRDEVIGFGIDYRENDRPPELFWKAYRIARKAGLRLTAHAGEFGMPWTNVETAIELIGVDRVDHGYTVLDHPEFARRCGDAGIVFTVVPTNSYYLRTLAPERWALDHPIRRMPAAGIRIHPNSDDPTLHNVTATDAWHMMIRHFGFGVADLRGFMLNGLDGAWLPDEVRRRWRTEWADEVDRLVDRHLGSSAADRR